MKKISAAFIAVAVAASVAVLPSANAAEEVTIFGGFGGDQAKGFQAELDAFGAANGIKITYTTLASYDTDIRVKVKAGQAPNIGMWPQPGGLLEYSSVLEPIDTLKSVDLAGIKKTLVPGWAGLATKGGKTYGLPVSANVKSLVWYNPANFKAAGLTVPKTDADMTKLTNTIKSKKLGYPWCIGIESGGATGWAFTDWVEQYVLNYNGVDVYNQWISGEVGFDDPRIVKAVDEVSRLLLADGQVNGGGAKAATTGFGDTAALFETGGKSKGQCFMLRQGSFITDFFPEDIKAQVVAGDYTNANVFTLPAPEGGQLGVIGGGDLAGAFNLDADTVEVLKFILSDKIGTIMAQRSSFTSPHATFDSSLYPNELTQKVGETMANAAVFGFDGSDRMPSEVNAEFWAAGTEYVAGKISWAEAAERINSKY